MFRPEPNQIGIRFRSKVPRELSGMPVARVLIVDNETSAIELCRKIVSSCDCEVLTALTIEEAIDLLKHVAFDVVIASSMVSAGGLRLPDLQRTFPGTAVIILEQGAEGDTAIRARLDRPESVRAMLQPGELRDKIECIIRSLDSSPQGQVGNGGSATRGEFSGLIGISPAMQRVYRIMTKVAQHSYPVLVQGESGTGKELVARSIHLLGPRRDRPFVPVDCSALAPTLVESELFGYVKGAFTGAYRSKQGLIESAEGGTLFLDEIGDLAFDLQSKLLRVIQESEFRPLGSTERRSVSTRVIAATNRNLERLIEENKFRQDLYFRLNVVQVTLPPLRERKSDIPLLARQFLEKCSGSGSQPPALSDDGMKKLLDYDWPGNVRELENAIAHAVALGTGPVLVPADLPLKLQAQDASGTGAAQDSLPLDELERQAIRLALRQADGDKTAAARILGIGKSTLYRRLRELEK